MEKTEVYIDFEAISNQFARLINLPSGTPFAYTLGLLNEKNQFETKTFVMDFTMHNTLTSIWIILRKFIIQDINKINKHVNIKNIIFIGHNPDLETKCIKRLFPENETKPLISQKNISLSKLTAKYITDNYFSKLKKIIKMNYSDDLVLNQMLDRNGAIASFAGYWLYTNSIKNLKPKDKRTKYYLALDKKSLLRELKAYSEDDVKRMIYINTHMSNEDIDKLAKEINQKRELIKILKLLNIDEKTTIKDLKEKIWSW